MTEKFTHWWRERSEREQVMLAVMAMLAALVFGWLLVVRPLDAALANARAEQDAAITRLERVKTAAAALDEAGTPIDGSPHALIARSAAAAGFVPTRLDPGANGAVMLGLSSAKAVALSKWLKSLEAEGVHVEQITIRPNSDSTLSVDATLKARTG